MPIKRVCEQPVAAAMALFARTRLVGPTKSCQALWSRKAWELVSRMLGEIATEPELKGSLQAAAHRTTVLRVIRLLELEETSATILNTLPT